MTPYLYTSGGIISDIAEFTGRGSGSLARTSYENRSLQRPRPRLSDRGYGKNIKNWCYIQVITSALLLCDSESIFIPRLLIRNDNTSESDATLEMTSKTDSTYVLIRSDGTGESHSDLK